ncbi:ketoacyl-ACP synthase III [Bacteroidota bacterium]
MNSALTSLGIYVPERVVDNYYYEKIVETSDEWITTRTGIKERRFSGEEESTTDLCVKAAKNMAIESNVLLKNVDFVIVATSTSEHTIPSIASQVMYQLQIENAGSLDISAACAGFVYGIIVAHGLIHSGAHKKILVIAADALSQVTDFTDRTTCILFGDGAGAALIEASEEKRIFKTVSGTLGENGKDLYLSQSAKKLNGVEIEPNNKIHQNGRVVFKWAVQSIPEYVRQLLEINNLCMKDIDWFIPHSANLRIIESICKNLDYPLEKTLESIVHFGNTSAATIPIAFDKGLNEGKIKKGDLILLIGFGGGLTYAGAIIKW